MPTSAELERAACAQGRIMYRDPDSGNWVLTSSYLAAKGHCCHHACRHCPYPVKQENPHRSDSAPGG